MSSFYLTMTCWLKITNFIEKFVTIVDKFIFISDRMITMSKTNLIQFDQSKCVDKKWSHQNVSKYWLIDLFKEIFNWWKIFYFSVLIHNLSDSTRSGWTSNNICSTANDYTQIWFNSNVNGHRMARKSSINSFWSNEEKKIFLFFLLFRGEKRCSCLSTGQTDHYGR